MLAAMAILVIGCTDDPERADSPPASAETGRLDVRTEPALDARIEVAGRSTDDGRISGLEVPAGDRQVCFGEVAGFISPGCQAAVVNPDATTTVIGTYRVDEAAEPTREDDVAHGEGLRPGHVGIDPERELQASGPIETTEHGQVIEGLHISAQGRDESGLTVRHDDVIIRNNRIDHEDGATGIMVEDDASGVLIEWNELDAIELSLRAVGHRSDGDGGSLNNNVGQRAIQIEGSNATVRRNLLRFTRSGIRVVSDGVIIEENYIAELASRYRTDEDGRFIDSPDGKKLHGTAGSIPGGSDDVQFVRNRLPAGDSGGINVYGEYGPNEDILIADNLLVGTGEGFAIYGGRTHDPDNFERHRSIRIEGNRFTGQFGFTDVLGEGTNAAVDLDRPGNTFVGNRWVDETDDLPARCGIEQDDCV